MFNIKNTSKLALVGLTTMALLAACSTNNEEKVNEKKKIVIGTSTDYKPFEFHDENNKIVGFDIDFANYLAKELNYEIEIKDMKFEDLMENVKDKKVDMAIAGIAPTEEREKYADFSDLYYLAKSIVVFEKENNFKNLESLDGKTLGVLSDSVQKEDALDIQSQVKNLKIVEKNNVEEMLQGLKTGELDAIVIEDTIVNNLVGKELKSIELVQDDIRGNVVMLPKGSEEVDKVNEIVKEMKTNGELDKLIEKWVSQ